MAFLLIMNGFRRKEEALAARIAPEILRFHVLANSDSKEDQALKLEVKDLLLKKIRAEVDEEILNSREDLCRYIEENRSSLEETANACIRENGFSYTTDIRLETCLFPEKTYGDMTFPAGKYKAVRVLIGKGAGRNFWCVLYPSLCYSDSVHAVVPESSKEQLKSLLPEEDFAALMRTRRLSLLPAGAGAKPETPAQKTAGQENSLPRIKCRFKLKELLSL